MDSEAQSYATEDSIRAQFELARRFLAAQSNVAIELKPGELAIELPLPSGAWVAGSLMWGEEPASMIIDTPQAPEDAFAFYDEHLPALGWAADDFMWRGGFIPSASSFSSTPPFIPSRYISDERGKMLMVAVKERPEGGSTLYFTLMHAPDRAQWEQRPHPPTLQRALPPLMAPRGASLNAEGSGGSDTSWRTYARMTTTLELEAIMSHFNKQLDAGGWRSLEGQTLGAAGWSLWSVDVESRSMIGALVALRVPSREDEYLLEARLEAEERQQPGGGGFSYAPLVGWGGPRQSR